MSTVTMTEMQIGALHDLTLAFRGAEVDVVPADHRSLDVTIYTPAPDGDRITAGSFSMSEVGTVRAREVVTA